MDDNKAQKILDLTFEHLERIVEEMRQERYNREMVLKSLRDKKSDKKKKIGMSRLVYPK